MGVIRGPKGHGSAFVACRAIRSPCSSPSCGLVKRCCGSCPARGRQKTDGAAGARRLCLQEKERPPRICARALRKAADGEIEAVKHPQDGAGILTSLTETDGLLEFPEDVTAIEPGARVGFLSYAALIG